MIATFGEDAHLPKSNRRLEEVVDGDLPFDRDYTPEAWFLTGICHARLGQGERALPYLQRVLENWPDYKYAWDAQVYVGVCYEQLKRANRRNPNPEYDQAIEDAYTAVLENYGDCTLVFYANLRLAELKYKQQRWVESAMHAEQYLTDKWVAPSAQRASVLYKLGQCYENMGEYTAQLVVLDSDYSECDEDCPDHQSDPAFRSIRIVEVASISGEGVTSDATGTPSASQTIYVAKGAPSSTITLTANMNPSGGSWPTGEPTWTNATATATADQATFPIDTVSASSSGTIVTASCGTCGTCTKKIKIMVYETKLKSIKFTSDHGTMNDNNSDWLDSGTVYTEPEWVNSRSVNNPITHTMSTSLVIEATVIVGPSGLSFDLSGDGSENYLDFTESGNTSTGSDQAISITADASLPGTVDTIDESIAWEIKLTDPTPDVDVSVGNSGSHKIYVTCGTPSGSILTEKRVSTVTTACDGMSSEPAIVDKPWTDIIGSTIYTLGAPYPTPEWKILGGTPGECDAIANLFEQTIQMIGLTPGDGDVTYLYADENGGSFESASDEAYVTRACGPGSHGHTSSVGSTHDDEQTFEELGFIDGSGGSNVLEACYKYRHTSSDPWKWYAPGTTTGVFTSVQNVMNAIVDYTYWAYLIDPSSL